MELAQQWLQEVWVVLLELSPWMLIGMAVAGLLHGVLPKNFIRRQLQGPFGVIKAVILGVPLPLCSCGVIPAGLGLKQDGASNGSSVAFLIATPQTGVDSILVSAGLLGLPFALFKVGTAAITGMIGGWISDAVTTESMATQPEIDHGPGSEGANATVRNMVTHAVEVLRSIWKWLVFGVLVSASISVFVPTGGLASLQAGGGILAAVAMLAVSIPLYVCATASVPIAAALVAGGMPTGAALVFLMAGPATNVATIGAIYRGFGGRILGVYLATILVGSIGFGMAFDWIITAQVIQESAPHEHGVAWWAWGSTVILLGLVVWFFVQDATRWVRGLTAGTVDTASSVELDVSGMTCGGCVNKLDGALRKLEGADFVSVQLNPQRAVVGGSVTEADVKTVIRAAGFETP